MRALSATFAAGTLLIFYGVASAGVEERTMTLDDCVRFAAAHSPVICQARSQATASVQGLEAVSAERNPRISVGSTATQDVYVARDLQDAVSYNVVQAQATVTKKLLPDRLYRQRLDLSEIDVRSAGENQKGIVGKTILAVRESYWEVLSAKRDRALRAESAERVRKISEIVRTKAKFGYASQLDLDRSQVELALSEDDLISAETRLRIAQEKLKALLGADAAFQVDPVDSFGDGPPNLDGLLEASPVPTRPAVEIERLLLESRTIESDVLKKPRRPVFALGATYQKANGESASVSLNDQWEMGLGGGSIVSRSFPVTEQNNYHLNMNFSYEIFDGRILRHQQEQAAALLEKQRETLREAVLKSSSTLAAARARLSEAISRHGSLTGVSRVAFRARQAADIGFRRGKVDLTELLLTEARVVDAKSKEDGALWTMYAAAEEVRFELQGDLYANIN